MGSVHANRVAEYYDHNTAPFLRWGGSGTALAAIHRELWGPSVVNSAQAFEYVNQYVLSQLGGSRSSGRLNALDLGCGIGGTATWLAQRADTYITGVTLSPVQCEWARERAAKLGLGARCTFSTADMTATALPAPFDVAYAIESLIHVADADSFFREAARLVRPGGKLVLCDDYLAPITSADASRARWLAAFTRGWRAFGLRSLARTVEVANFHGFTLTHHENVTAYQRAAAPWVIHLGHALLQLPLLRSPYWDSLRGSTALQHCIRNRWVEYHLSTFTRGNQLC